MDKLEASEPLDIIVSCQPQPPQKKSQSEEANFRGSKFKGVSRNGKKWQVNDIHEFEGICNGKLKEEIFRRVR
jgi:hypothetical protein